MTMMLAARGRGALSNPTGRFEALWREQLADGWDAPLPAPPLRTELAVDHSRSVITRNDSPDVPFDRSLNPYRGYEHGCIYCFARPSHAYLGLSPGRDFETRLFHKPDAAAQLAAAFRRPGYRPETIVIGANTDPYQPVERRLGLTRALLAVFRDHRHPVGLITKSDAVLRDRDILGDLAADGLMHVCVSVTTLDPVLARRMEPRATAPHRRLAAIRGLAEAGVPVTVLASPMIPGLNDHELEAILDEAARAGATAASTLLIRLPGELKALFSEWLETHYPNKAQKVLNLIRACHDGALYRSEFGTRMRGSGPFAALLAQRFTRARRRLRLGRAGPALRSDLFQVPDAQMRLL